MSNTVVPEESRRRSWLSPDIAFLLVSFCLGQLGDGLNIFQGIYLVGIGWNEGSVGAALSLMGLTALLVQPMAGDWVDKATIDRRVFLTVASIVTALSASTILLVRHGNTDHMLIYVSKVLEGIASSFIGPCLAALTLASFGPHHFDAVMARNLYWGHIGSVMSALLAGTVAYLSYPDIKNCFLVIGASAILAIIFVRHLPEGDPMMGRGFQGTATMDKDGYIEPPVVSGSETTGLVVGEGSKGKWDPTSEDSLQTTVSESSDEEDEEPEGEQGPPKASSYAEVFFDFKTCILCFTGFFFHFANANVLLVLGELMGGGKSDDGSDDDSHKRNAIPFTAGAIVTAQITMAVTTWIGDRLTAMGIGRKPLFMAAILSLPIRCALIILWKDAGETYLLSTQILDGVAGGLMGLIHPYLVADITFGTGRFNVVMGMTASCFGMGATLSNFIGQMVVEHFGHVASLTGSLILSIAPIVLFSNMPETYGHRGDRVKEQKLAATPKKNGGRYQTFHAADSV